MIFLPRRHSPISQRRGPMPPQQSADSTVTINRYVKSTSAYAEKFGDVPTLLGLNSRQLAAAMDLLDEAVEYDVPYGSDADFYEALGMQPPPEGALI
jgi:hypothetical protein